MPVTQQIFRVRRQYNQWVANQTLEDYALRFTAKKARRWSAGRVGMTALGATAFLALEAIGGTATINYGFINTVLAMLTVAVVILVTGLPISYYAAKHGLDIDLLTRGAGFGYLGSTITSLIYASFTFIFFAIEAAILAMALQTLFGIPMAIGYVICVLAVVPIVTHGITVLSRFQVGTFPIWLALQVTALFSVVYYEMDNIIAWSQYAGLQTSIESSPGSGFDLLLFGAAASMLFAMVAQIGEQVDYLRFLPPRSDTSAVRWWTALLVAGPGWIFIGLIKMLLGSFLAYLALTHGLPAELAADPMLMYQTAFLYLTESPTGALILAGVMVIISQMKINVTNAYAGSIAWSNFFSRLTHSHPGRVVWLFFNVTIALLLMELGVYHALENILSVFAIVAVSWIGSLSADLLINKNLGISPRLVEFKRAHLYDINPVGVGSMIVSTTLGFLCYLNLFGPVCQALAHFVTLGSTFVLVPCIGYLTGGRYYIAREAHLPISVTHVYDCSICENEFEHEDMSHCPAYQGAICSLCCSLDARCGDMCKPGGRFSEQMTGFFGTFLPKSLVKLINSRSGHFIAILGIIAALNGGLLSLVYYHISPQDIEVAAVVVNTLWTLFFVLLIVSGVFAWLILLAHESRVFANQESDRQTSRLVAEIESHQQTDQALQVARDLAEAANQAKSRYLTGISHELRTPLQSILGYAQILSRDARIPEESKEAIDIVHRSSEYLADLIEGLLDISRIESGRLDIRRDQVDLQELLNQIVHMFRLQTENKSIDFDYNCTEILPRYVICDEKRLRQILINLLTNAVKFTEHGRVSFSVSYRSQVAEFVITDTGVGIDDGDLQRIFKPFERIRKVGVPGVQGTGLGLTIVQLLVDIMGGDVKVESRPGVGSRFSVKLMLSRIDSPLIDSPPLGQVMGYGGATRTVLVVDDEPTHRGLISDLLSPLGFSVLEAPDAMICLEMVRECEPDIFLLDVSMPGMDGLQLAQHLKSSGVAAPIVMLSADAQEHHINPHTNDAKATNHDAYLVKPIKVGALQDVLGSLLDLEWQYELSARQISSGPTKRPLGIEVPQTAEFEALCSYAEIGYLKGIKEKLKQIENQGATEPQLIDYLKHLARQVQFSEMVAFLQSELKSRGKSRGQSELKSNQLFSQRKEVNLK